MAAAQRRLPQPPPWVYGRAAPSSDGLAPNRARIALPTLIVSMHGGPQEAAVQIWALGAASESSLGGMGLMQAPWGRDRVPACLDLQPDRSSRRSGSAGRRFGPPSTPTPHPPQPRCSSATMQAAAQQAQGCKSLAAKASGQRQRLGSALASSGEALGRRWGSGSPPRAARGTIAARIGPGGPGDQVRRR